MANIDFTKFRVPLGSLAVDATLVVTLIWWGATITQKLDEMSRRVTTVETQRLQPEADRRLSVIEAELANNARWRDRIESKIDLLVETRRK